MIYKGYKKPLTTDDMWDLSPQNKTSSIIKKFNKVWLPTVEREKDLANKKSSKGQTVTTDINLLTALCKTFWSEWLFIAPIKFLASILKFVSPLVLDRLITFMTPNNTEPEWRGYLYASLMLVSPILESIFNGQYGYRNYLISMRIRNCIISVIYRKVCFYFIFYLKRQKLSTNLIEIKIIEYQSLKLSSSGRKNFTTGQIVNLIAVDSQRMMDFLNMASILWSAPLQIGIALYLLWQQLGVATLAGMLFMITLLPLNGLIAEKIRLKSKEIMKMKDKRVKLMNEILNGIRVFKLYAWETSFKHQVFKHREEEVRNLNYAAYLSGAMTFSFTCAPFFVIIFI